MVHRSRRDVFRLTVEGARAFAPCATHTRLLKLKRKEDALVLLDSPRKVVPLDKLSATAAARARALPPGPCLIRLAKNVGQHEDLVVPARRVRSPEGLRLVLPYMAGLEFRPAAVAHSMRTWLA